MDETLCAFRVCAYSYIFKIEEFHHQIHTAGAKAVVTVPELLPVLSKVCSKVGIPPERIFLFGEKSVGAARPFYSIAHPTKHIGHPIQGVDPNDVAFLCFSSGTTGVAKGVMLTHRNFISQMISVTSFDQRANMPDDIILGFLPFFHIFGLTSLILGSFYRCIPVVVMAKYELEKFCQLVQKYKITNVSIVPPVGKW